MEILLKAQRRPTTFDDKALLYMCSICCTIKKEFQINVLGGNVDATPKATKCVSTITFRVVCFFIAENDVPIVVAHHNWLNCEQAL